MIQKSPKNQRKIPSRSDLGPARLRLGAILAVMEPSWAILGPSWVVLGLSGDRLGAVLGRLGASWGVLERLGGVWAPSWPSKTSQHKPDSTWNGKRRSFKGSFMQKPQRTILDRKASSRSRTLRSLRSLARCARPAGFHWGFAGVLLGGRWRSWIANLPNALQIFRKILGKSSSIPPKIHPKTTKTPLTNP